MPDKDVTTGDWTDDASFTKWYLYDLESGDILDDATRIFGLIESTPMTPRKTEIEKPKLVEIRHIIDEHIKNSYLRKVQAPIDAEPTLLAWMELV